MRTQGAVLVGLAFSLAVGPAAPAQVLRPPLVDGVTDSSFFQKDITVGDVNGDGHPDVVATTSDETRVVLGTPDGPYGGSEPFLGGGGLLACELADLDGDGLVDVASAPSTGGVRVRLNQGGGVFVQADDVEIARNEISGNKVEHKEYNAALGGGIYAAGKVRIIGNVVRDNRAERGAGIFTRSVRLHQGPQPRRR